MYQNDKPTTPKTKDDSAHDLGQMGITPKATTKETTMQKKKVSQAKPTSCAEVLLVPLALIDVKPQVRTVFNNESIQELAEDIGERGLMQPILLNPNGSRYLVIAGERRLRAFYHLHRTEIPALLVKTCSGDAMLMQLAENIQREELTTLDTAAAVRKLFENLGSGKAVAAKVKKSKAWVSKHLAISHPEFTSSARDLIEDGTTEDLDLVLIAEQAIKENYSLGMEMVAAIHKGEVNRTSARELLATLKQKQEDKNKHWEEKRLAQQKKYDEERKARKNAPREFDMEYVAEEIEDMLRDESYQSTGAILADYTDDQISKIEDMLQPTFDHGKISGGDVPAILRYFMTSQYNTTALHFAAFMAGCSGQARLSLPPLIEQLWTAAHRDAGEEN